MSQVSQLEIEIQGIPKSLRPQYAARLKQAKTELAKYKKLSKDSHAQLARTDLLGPRSSKSLTSNSDDPYDERSERARLLAGTDVLSDGGRRLTDSTRLALETEEQGADILRTLRVQREQIENSRDMVRVAGPNHILSSSYLTSQVRTSDSHIDRAAGTIKGMIVQ